ncbi:MAG: hypothetical protein AABY30_04980, partial [Candidatus Thermoplasmatota archaeon]
MEPTFSPYRWGVGKLIRPDPLQKNARNGVLKGLSSRAISVPKIGVKFMANEGTESVAYDAESIQVLEGLQ